MATDRPDIWNNSDPFDEKENDQKEDDQISTPSDENGERISTSDTIGNNQLTTDDPTFRRCQSENDAAPRIHFANVRAAGASRHFNPTSVRMDVRMGESPDDVRYTWRSRDNRKGRNSLALARTNSRIQLAYPNPPIRKVEMSSSFTEVMKGIWKMCTTFPYWDMAFWSGWSYTIGSMIFVICGLFAWLPIAFPATTFATEEDASGYLFFFGTIFYEVGATVAWWEAVNEGTFCGSAMRRFVDGSDEHQKRLLDDKIKRLYGRLHRKRSQDEERAEYWDGYRPRRGGIDLGDAGEEEESRYLTWKWFPTWDALIHHHIFEIGFVACTIQWIGATLYFQCGVVAIPGVLSSLEYPWQINFAYYIPQIVASCCFLSAAVLFTLETQDKWYKPEWRLIGWWIGLWATIGSMGFLLCGCFGPVGNFHDWGEYQSNLSSFWGSSGYLFSSALQWYEAVNKNAVELMDEPGDVKGDQVDPA